MIEPPQIVQTELQLTARLHVIVPRAEIQQRMGPAIQEVMAAVMAQGVGPAGPWFTHHFKIDPATFDFDVCVPVRVPLVASGRVEPGQWPAMRMARTVYHGGYEGLAAAWPKLHAWVAQSGHSPAGDLWERYLVGPESSTDPASWRTELNRPLID